MKGYFELCQHLVEALPPCCEHGDSQGRACAHCPAELCWAGRFLGGAQAGLTRRPKAGGFVFIFQSVADKPVCLKKYVYGFGTQQKSLPFEGPVGAYAGCSSSGSSRDDPWPNPCVWEEVQAVMLIPFFIFLMKPPSCHFRGEEALTSCADESLLLTGQQAGIESAVWSSCSVNHSQKALRKLKGNACE